MSEYQLAQLNIAKMKYPVESPEMAEFVDNLERINSLAENSPGYVWRLQVDGGDATGIRFFGDDYLVNMSVWRDVESLRNFVYRSAHTQVLARRKEWFDTITESYSVLWWIAHANIPSLQESQDKLNFLRLQGPSPEAFTFKTTFSPPDE